jgi:hypothetical protein
MGLLGGYWLLVTGYLWGLAGRELVAVNKL